MLTVGASRSGTSRWFVVRVFGDGNPSSLIDVMHFLVDGATEHNYRTKNTICVSYYSTNIEFKKGVRIDLKETTILLTQGQLIWRSPTFRKVVQILLIL